MRDVRCLPPSRALFAPADGLRTISVPVVSMNQLIRNRFLTILPFAGVALSLQGCGVATSEVNLTPGPEPLELTVTPAVLQAGGSAQVKVVSPSADSISIESANGLDRYWSTGSKLRTRIESDFGDSVPGVQYAVREHGQLFDVLKKPMKVVVCRKGTCREYY